MSAAKPAIVPGMVDLPWDCVVLGIPKSVQANRASKQRWKAEVHAAAVAAWPVDCPAPDLPAISGRDNAITVTAGGRR